MFELLLAITGLFVVVLLILLTIALLCRNWKRASSHFFRCLIVVAVYFGVLIIVSLVSPQRVLPIGEDWCFDDWCVAVDGVEFVAEAGPKENAVRAKGVFFVVQLRLSNHARGRDQRAGSAAVYLIDGFGHRYDVSNEGQLAYEALHGPAPPLTVTIPVGQSVNTVRVFDVPDDVREVGLTVEHPVGFSPGNLVIGDQSSLFHKRTVIRLK
jgi:hypothetical protein